MSAFPGYEPRYQSGGGYGSHGFRGARHRGVDLSFALADCAGFWIWIVLVQRARVEGQLEDLG
jgi:hypothetical protein